jgi:hypothetical protein
VVCTGHWLWFTTVFQWTKGKCPHQLPSMQHAKHKSAAFVSSEHGLGKVNNLFECTNKAFLSAAFHQGV